MTVPNCANCGAARWAAIYRVQAERIWSIGEGDSEPSLDHEEEDFGEWDHVHCSVCHQSGRRVNGCGLWHDAFKTG